MVKVSLEKLQAEQSKDRQEVDSLKKMLDRFDAGEGTWRCAECFDPESVLPEGW